MLSDFDRIEYNNDHAETRRHCCFNPDIEDSVWLSCIDFDPANMLRIQELIEEREPVKKSLEFLPPLYF